MLGVSNKTIINRCVKLCNQGFLIPNIVKTRVRSYSLSEFAKSSAEQLLKRMGISEEFAESKSKEVIGGVEISKEDIRILEDIHGMKEAQRKRLMKYMEVLKQVEALEELE